MTMIRKKAGNGVGAIDPGAITNAWSNGGVLGFLAKELKGEDKKRIRSIINGMPQEQASFGWNVLEALLKKQQEFTELGEESYKVQFEREFGSAGLYRGIGDYKQKYKNQQYFLTYAQNAMAEKLLSGLVSNPQGYRPTDEKIMELLNVAVVLDPELNSTGIGLGGYGYSARSAEGEFLTRNDWRLRKDGLAWNRTQNAAATTLLSGGTQIALLGCLSSPDWGQVIGSGLKSLSQRLIKEAASKGIGADTQSIREIHDGAIEKLLEVSKSKKLSEPHLAYSVAHPVEPVVESESSYRSRLGGNKKQEHSAQSYVSTEERASFYGKDKDIFTRMELMVKEQSLGLALVDKDVRTALFASANAAYFDCTDLAVSKQVETVDACGVLASLGMPLKMLLSWCKGAEAQLASVLSKAPLTPWMEPSVCAWVINNAAPAEREVLQKQMLKLCSTHPDNNLLTAYVGVAASGANWVQEVKGCYPEKFISSLEALEIHRATYKIVKDREAQAAAEVKPIIRPKVRI